MWQDNFERAIAQAKEEELENSLWQRRVAHRKNSF